MAAGGGLAEGSPQRQGVGGGWFGNTPAGLVQGWLVWQHPLAGLATGGGWFGHTCGWFGNRIIVVSKVLKHSSKGNYGGRARRSSLGRSLSCWRSWGGGAVTLSRQHGRQPYANFPHSRQRNRHHHRPRPASTDNPTHGRPYRNFPPVKTTRPPPAPRIAGNPPGEPQDPGDPSQVASDRVARRSRAE